MAGSVTQGAAGLVWLVQHGEAEAKSRDPQRPLTAAGRLAVEAVAAWAGEKGLRVEQIRHSGKLRARQTAEIFADKLGAPRSVASCPGLGPNDDVGPVARELADQAGAVMIVGHLPFLDRLVGRMVAEDPERHLVRFRNGGLVGLVREEERWAVAVVVPPEMVARR